MDGLEHAGGNTKPIVVPRRQFFRTIGVITAVTTTGVVSFDSSTAHAATSHTSTTQATDLDILNYALTLEHLEAEFYKMAVSGGQLSGSALTYLTAIRDHEIAHVNAITAVIVQLGGTPVAKRNSYNFGDMSTQAKILATAEVLEDTGVGAYTGQAANITDKAAILPAAASIEQVESRHYATIRLLNGSDGAPSAFGPSKTMDEVLAAIQPFLGNS